MTRFVIIAFLFLLNPAWGIILFSQQAGGTIYRFDFGSSKNEAGYIPITPGSVYNERTGYGFNKGAEIESADRGGNRLSGDFITARRPFFFSVKLPEGNYNVRLLLGDARGRSATTVRAECRRLMLENIITQTGEFTWQSFTVHLRDSFIRNPTGYIIDKVRLKPREVSFSHWDHVLTIEFNDSMPKVCAMEIIPNHTATTLFLAGNSTVVDQDKEPWAAWGQMFPVFLIPGRVSVANYAESGETLLAFRREKRLDKIWSMAKAGDYLFIEFAHNDQKPGGNHLYPFTTYKETLKVWIAEARSRNMIPVLVTSMHRRSFDAGGHIINTLSDYPEAMRQVAQEEQVVLIDLNRMSKTLYEAWGEEGSIKAFVHYPANTFPGQAEALNDNTHFNAYGAYELARCIVSDIKKQYLPLAAFIRQDFSPFDPAIPLPAGKFYWPGSPVLNSVKTE